MGPAIRLVQGEDVDAWQRALLLLCLPAADSTGAPGTVLDVPVVVVPSRAAADQWQRTLEQRLLVEHWMPPRALQTALGHEVAPCQYGALALPRLLTRDQLYEAFHRSARLDVPRLSPLVREVLMGASARKAAQVQAPPFLLRPGLVAEMLRFHDHIGRLNHEASQWLESAAAQLESEAPVDRGAARLLQQTRFLQETFRDFEARVDTLEGLDDRALRAVLRASSRAWCPPHIIVAVPDHHADAHGLWPADWSLIAHAPGVTRIDVVATQRVADVLFSRLRRVWPMAGEVRVPRQRPSETRLETGSADRRWIACRDRDEEVVSYARGVKTRLPADASTSALVYRRPLPYLYAAQSVLGAAGIPYQSSGTLPLAAEPWAAGLDLLMDAALSGFTRASLVTLLRSPHVRLQHQDGAPVTARDVAAFDGWLARQRYLGTLDHLDALLNQMPSPSPVGMAPAASSGAPSSTSSSGSNNRLVAQWQEEQTARSVALAVRPWLGRLAPLQSVGGAADHVRALHDAWRACERLPGVADPEASRTRRTRAAVDLLLEQLAQALAEHDPTPVPARDTCTLIRRWIEERTFALPRDEEGVQLVDADAAPFGLFDHVRIVGLLEGEWPEPSAREIFYPAFMLERLGWAEERTRTAALRARFADLLTLPVSAVGVSVPELDQDAVVRPSSLLDELDAFHVDRLEPLPADDMALAVTREDALLATPAFPSATVLEPGARDWAAWRLSRPQRPAAGQTAGATGERYSVTAVETYLQCPFQYFAGRVLGLKEEADDEPGLPAREAGVLLHDVLHDCLQEWRNLGHTAIGSQHLAEARAVFTAVAERALRGLPPADRAVERVRLLGSAVATGVLEKLLRVEVELFGDVTRRSLEHPIDQDVTLPASEGTRDVRLRGRIDRVDWTTDGRIRVLDYKTGRRPTQALQPGVYAHAVAQQEAAAGRQVEIAPSGFVAFREDVPWVQSVVDRASADTQARVFVEAVERIEAGDFPVKPHNPFRCQFCDYASVCRKDYVGDE